MTVRFTMKGDSEFRANLRKLAEIPRADMDEVLAAALEPMRSATEENAKQLREPGSPKGGHLDEGIVAVPARRQSSRTRIEWWISFTRRARKIAHLVEFGTAPHEQPQRGRKHPGSRAKPFFRPAFDANSEEVLRRLGNGIKAVLFRGLN